MGEPLIDVLATPPGERSRAISDISTAPLDKSVPSESTGASAAAQHSPMPIPTAVDFTGAIRQPGASRWPKTRLLVPPLRATPAVLFAAITQGDEVGGVPRIPYKVDFPFTARDEAIYLLHVGAEVEHSLMAQYLYAGYSLNPALATTSAQQKVIEWRNTILEIAREEMGHLALVENVITLIGGPLSFRRQDFPGDDDLYPFQFELEPLSKRSLAKYVLAECPNDAALAAMGKKPQIDEIREYLGTNKVNRVGLIYERVLKLFTPPTDGTMVKPGIGFIQTSEIQADSVQFQVDPGEWRMGYKELLIATAGDRNGAIDAIKKVAEQGEGSTLKDLPHSHFGKFLKIYEDFPVDWTPTLDIAKNPTTDPHAPIDNRIVKELTALWAGLFNLRYRMLLGFLAHSFRVEAPLKASARSPRGLLVSWAFGEMYNVRSIAEILMRLPMGGENGKCAGPPFELPYTLDLAPRDRDRWRGHRDLMLSTRVYIEKLKEEDRDERRIKYLDALRTTDDLALGQVMTLIGG
jgi:hypothetical protein